MSYFPRNFRNDSLSKKNSELFQNCQKCFPGDSSPEGISPGKLSVICGQETLDYSREFVLLKCVMVL